MTFDELLHQVRPVGWEPPSRLLAIDPGETVGYAIFRHGQLDSVGQLTCASKPATVLDLAMRISELVKNVEPLTKVVIEDYRVYANKAKMHSWNALHTPKLIGAIQGLCMQYEIPVVLQGASSMQFCTNKKLKEWGYYQQGMSHANDAIRHGCYYLLFNKKE